MEQLLSLSLNKANKSKVFLKKDGTIQFASCFKKFYSELIGDLQEFFESNMSNDFELSNLPEEVAKKVSFGLILVKSLEQKKYQLKVTLLIYRQNWSSSKKSAKLLR